jgi:hypothetical protein
MAIQACATAPPLSSNPQPLPEPIPGAIGSTTGGAGTLRPHLAAATGAECYMKQTSQAQLLGNPQHNNDTQGPHQDMAHTRTS